MALTNILPRKRARSPVKPFISIPPRKTTRCGSAQYDGVQSHDSVESATANETLTRSSVRDRLKKRMDNIRAMLLVRNKERNIDEVMKHATSNTSVIITRPSTIEESHEMNECALHPLTLELDTGSGHHNSSPPSTGPSIDSSRSNQLTSTSATSDTTVEILTPNTYRVHFLEGCWDNESRKLDGLLNTQSGLSVRTVEATAMAKIFLETHFNSLLNGMSSRELRQHQLEERISHLGLSVHEIYRKVQDLFNYYESNQLRHERVCKMWKRNQSCTASIALAGFQTIKVLGKGSFGVVRLVRENVTLQNSEGEEGQHRPISCDTWPAPDRIETTRICAKLRRESAQGRRRVYAMKVIRKSEMLRNCQEGHLKAERDFLVAAEGSRWIVPLLAAFQDQKFLYLVMEYCIGGDFLGLLIRCDILGEELTRWYVAEMILCVEETHRMKWIHRDVKPDNFLIGADGHLKISDFGLAFDGGWEHDQKYFQKQRHCLLERLGLNIDGDDQDQQDHQTVENSRRLAKATRRASRKYDGSSSSQEGPPIGEPIIDWRNRVQRRRLARSVVGTSQYMAPEIIRGDSYDGRCD